MLEIINLKAEIINLYQEDVNKNKNIILNEIKNISLFSEEKIIIVNQIKNGNQVFWICPLIEESKILNYSSAIKRFNLIEKKFPKKVGLIHGELKKNDNLGAKSSTSKPASIACST